MTHEFDRTRRRLLAGVAAGTLASMAVPLRAAHAADAALVTRPIPHGGEPLPIVGIGTAVIFNFENDPAAYAERRQVIQTLIAGGGKLIDTAAGYGRAEDRLGELIADLGVRDQLFLATKFSYQADRATATASLQSSLKRLKTNRIDLMQAWNVGDPNYDFGLLRE